MGPKHIQLAFSLDQSDQSSCAKQAQKRIETSLTTSETTDKAANIAAQAVPVAPEKALSKKGGSQTKGAPKAKKPGKGGKGKSGAKGSKKAAKPGPKATTPRAESKGATILTLIQRPKGAAVVIHQAIDLLTVLLDRGDSNARNGE